MHLFIEPEAEAELEEAARRYEQTVPGLGLDFVEEIRQRTDAIIEAPLKYPRFGRAGDVRCAHAGPARFPHLIVYIVFGETVHVLAFMHPRQRPGYWQARLPER